MPEAMAPTRAWLGAFKAALEPYDAGRYLDFAEERFEMTQAFPLETVERLREVKQRYDPENVFQANHPVTGWDGRARPSQPRAKAERGHIRHPNRRFRCRC